MTGQCQEENKGAKVRKGRKVVSSPSDVGLNMKVARGRGKPKNFAKKDETRWAETGGKPKTFPKKKNVIIESGEFCKL